MSEPPANPPSSEAPARAPADTSTAHTSTAVDRASAPIELTKAEKTFIRISWLQTVLALAGLFTGAVALYAALHESAAVRRQSAAAVWPYIQVAINYSPTADESYFNLVLTNSGVGPARIKAIKLTLNGSPVRTWGDAVALLEGPEDAVYSQFTAGGRVLRPGDSVEMFATANRVIVDGMIAATASPGTAIEYCYCSIFDECWVARVQTGREDPTPVAACPDYGAAAFAN